MTEMNKSCTPPSQSSNPELFVQVAFDAEYGISVEGRLPPWNIPEDKEYFTNVTSYVPPVSS